MSLLQTHKLLIYILQNVDDRAGLDLQRDSACFVTGRKHLFHFGKALGIIRQASVTKSHKRRACFDGYRNLYLGDAFDIRRQYGKQPGHGHNSCK